VVGATAIERRQITTHERRSHHYDRRLEVFILLGLMFLLAVVGVLAIIIGVVDIWPRIEGTPMKLRVP
jgi:hypothetical protein